MVLPRFLTELKRRNVYRAALVYAGVGWLILEAADVILPRLGLPDWTVNAVLAVVLLGFPLALVFAWIFDLNTQGIVRTEPLSQDAHHQISITSAVEFVVICTLVATAGYLYVDRLSLQRSYYTASQGWTNYTLWREPRPLPSRALTRPLPR